MDENDQYKAFLQKYLGVIKNIIPLKNPPKKYPKTSRDRRILMRKKDDKEIVKNYNPGKTYKNQR